MSTVRENTAHRVVAEFVLATMGTTLILGALSEEEYLAVTEVERLLLNDDDEEKARSAAFVLDMLDACRSKGQTLWQKRQDPS